METVFDVFFRLTGWLVGIVLVAAAFVHLAAPQQSRALLERYALPPIALSVVVLFAAQLLNSGDPGIYLLLALASLAAYGVRKARAGRPQVPRRSGGVQRTPVFPRDSGGDES